MFSHLSGLLRYDVLEKAFYDVATVWLPRMNSARAYDTNFVLIAYVWVGDC